MGVRGLTSYIAKYAERYLKPFELHDCNLVIDGDSLVSNLYQHEQVGNSAFGGDYDEFYRVILNFFKILKQCNVTAFVILDGGYERKKLRTVHERLRGKIGAIKRINPTNALHIFPIMMREVFCDAIRDIGGVPIMRCIFEADDEVAMLARRLNCPVLSYDSDFYIHNVRYIPTITLTLKVLRHKTPRKNRRRPAETNLIRRMEFKPYNYLDCCVYDIENLINNQSNGVNKKIDKNLLPLFATLLGNDYVQRFIFRKFYANLSLKHIGKRNSQQQKRIIALLRWLRNESSLDECIEKVLARVEKEKRPQLLIAITAAMSAYTRTDSFAFSFFGLNDADIYLSDDINESEEAGSDDECDDDDDIESYVEEEDVDVDDDDDDDDGEDIDVDDIFSDGPDEISDNELDSAAECNNDDNSEEILPSEKSKIHNSVGKEKSNLFSPPDWIKRSFLRAELPRYIIDLLYLKLYVNSPQIENFTLADSNEIALPILRYIFTLIHFPNSMEFQYLTRVQRISNVHTKRITTLDLNDFNFDGAKLPIENLEYFLKIFDDFLIKKTIILNLIHNNTIPEDFQLYFLCLIYLGKHSTILTSAHFHSLLICWCLLNVVDKITNSNECQQKKSNINFEKIKKDNTKNKLMLNLKNIHEFINLNECKQLKSNLFQYFYLNDKIRAKHSEYSSTIIHVFAEFQAIIFQMNTLNALLKFPFKPIKLAKYFNGTFLYNITVKLQDRTDIFYYIRNFLFNDCNSFYYLYELLVNLLKPFVDCLSTEEKSKKSTRNQRKKNKRLAKKVKIINGDENHLVGDSNTPFSIDEIDGNNDDVDENDDLNVAYQDANNKFANLHC